MDGFNINIEGVRDTSSALMTGGSNFGQSVSELYALINSTEGGAWLGNEADQYRDRILAYKKELERISEAIDYWKNKTSKIADNFDAASSQIRNNISNLPE